MVALRLAIAYIFCAVIALGLSYYGLITVREKCEQGECSREPKPEPADDAAEAGSKAGSKEAGMEAKDKPWEPQKRP